MEGSQAGWILADGGRSDKGIQECIEGRTFIEKAFEIMKNEIEDGRLRVKGTDALEGRLFVMFIALILYTALSNRMKEKEMYKKYTRSEVLYELKKIKVVVMLNGKRNLTEVTKKQRAIYEKLEVFPFP